VTKKFVGGATDSLIDNDEVFTKKSVHQWQKIFGVTATDSLIDNNEIFTKNQCISGK
jgi:hypothetical protein